MHWTRCCRQDDLVGRGYRPGHRTDRGRNARAHARPHHRRALQELSVLHQHQIVIDAGTRHVVLVGRPVPGNRNDCEVWVESAAKAAVGTTITIADGGYQGAGLVMPHRRCKAEELRDGKQTHNKSLKRVGARVEHVPGRCSVTAASKATMSITPCSASPGCTTSTSPNRQAAGLIASHVPVRQRSFTGPPLVGAGPLLGRYANSSRPPGRGLLWPGPVFAGRHPEAVR